MKLRKISAVAVAASAVALGTALMFTGTANAGAVQVEPTIADPEPTTIPGNKTDCDGLLGTKLFEYPGDQSASGPGGSGTTHTENDDDELTMLDVYVEPGYTVYVVVKAGSNGYNVYGPFVGEVTVTGMHAPETGVNNKIPGISHWFVCGEDNDPDDPDNPDDPDDPDNPDDPDDPDNPDDPDDTTTTTTTTTPGLPVTGAALTGLIAAGVALVAGGGATLFLLRRRRTALGE